MRCRHGIEESTCGFCLGLLDRNNQPRLKEKDEDSGGHVFTDTKICKECNEEKPLDDFQTNPRCKDGHLNTCKVCMGEKMRGPRKKKVVEPNHTEDPMKQPESLNLEIDISDYPHLLSELETAAYLHMRPMEYQAIAYIMDGLKRDEIIT